MIFTRSLLAFAVWIAALAVSPAESAAGISPAAAPEAYGKLPLSFEANRGQVDRRVKFLARGSGYNVLLTPTEIVVDLRRSPTNSRAASSDVRAGHAALRMRLIGANAKPPMIGLDKLPGTANYFIGNDPKKWRTDIPTYARVEYRNAYPGVDLMYYGNQRQLEYDFVVRPGADPRAISLAFQGADSLAVNDDGDLVLQAGDRQVRLRKPIIYQETGRGRAEVSGGYVVTGKNRIGFELGAYDPAKPLVIDPVLDYSTYLGGSGTDQGNAIAVDAAGNAYVTGGTSSTNFPLANNFPPGGNLACLNSKDAFIVKLNATGNALVYSTYLGGSGDDAGNGIAVDSAGNAYVTGSTCSTDFPKMNPKQSSIGSVGLSDAFVTKLNATGNGLVYSTYLGAAGSDEGTAIAVDSSNRAYVTGQTDSSGFPTVSPLSGQTTVRGVDAFVARFNSAGTALEYSTFLGGVGTDRGLGIAVDTSNNAYVTGSTDTFSTANNFPATAGAFQTTLSGVADAFVTKVNSSGSAITYSTYLGGPCNDVGQGIAVDATGNVYITGSTGSASVVLCVSNTFPTFHAFQPTFGGGIFPQITDAFVTKVNAVGTALVYSTFLGGNGDDFGFGIALDGAGNAYVAGSTTSTNFPTSTVTFDSTLGGVRDAFFTKIDPGQSGLASRVYSTYLGGSGDDQGLGIAVDQAGAAYVTGITTGSLPTSATPFDSTFGGVSDAFAAKLLETTTPGAVQFSAATYSVAENVAGGKATITVTRTGGFAGGVTVHYATSNGTATAGSDYTAASTTLSFIAGEASKSILIPIVNDGTAEANETLNLTLSSPGGGAVLGAQSTAVLTILNDDLSGTFQFSSAAYPVNEGAGSVTVTVNRTGSSGGDATVDYAVTGGTATGGGVDYTLANGTLTFHAGVTSLPITISIADDGESEPSETINLALSNVSPGAALGTQAAAVVTIQDNEPPAVQFSSGTYNASEAGPSATITVKRLGVTTSPVGVSYVVTDGTAISGVNYGTPSGTGMLTFGSGVVSQTFTIPLGGIFNDTIVNVNRTVNLALNIPTGGAALGSPNTAMLTITNDDVGGSLQFNPAAYSVSEDGGSVTITVTRTGGNASGVTVNYAVTGGGTATGGGVDYGALSGTGTLTFGAGVQSQTFTIPIIEDALVEGNETINLALSNPAPTGLPGSATLGAQSAATVTILDNEQGFQFSSPTYSIGELSATVPITVVRFGPTTGTVGVSYATSDGTAIAGTDYTAASGVLSFVSGVTSRTFNVPIKNDTLADGNRTVNLTLSTPTGGAGLGTQNTAVLIIQDNDAAGTVQFSAATYGVSEATATATITVTRIGGSASGVTVNYAVTGGSAILATDYGPLSGTGTLTFGAGVLSQTFTVPILNDTLVDGPKTVNLALSSPTGGAALGAQSTAVLTIQDNDVGGTLQFGAAAYSVNETGPTATITVTRTGGSASGVTVDYATSDGTATAGSDYTATTGTLTFATGQASRTFTIQITDDALAEGYEATNLALSNPQGGAVLGAGRMAVLTIVDNDLTHGLLQFSAATYTVAENVPGGLATITVTRTGDTTNTVTVDYATSNGTATAGSDYTATTGILTFATGQASRTFTIPITDDAVAEGYETANLTLSAPTNGAGLGAGRTAVLTIVDNDLTHGLLQFSAATYTVAENVSGGLATITVTRTGDTTNTVTVDYATSNGTATAGSDYTATNGTLTFATGQASRTFTIPITDDAVAEGYEAANLTLSAPTNGAGLGAGRTAVLTIVDNDLTHGLLQFSAATYTVAENVSGGLATITVTRTGDTTNTVTVDYATSNGTATAGSDYTATNGILTFTTGQASRTFTIPITDDAVAEGYETVNLTLSAPTNGAGLGAGRTAVLTIVDNDVTQGLLQFSAATYTVSEGVATGLATITVTRTGAPALAAQVPVMVAYAVTDGTATGGGVDYGPPSGTGTLTFGPGITSQTVTIPILPDAVAEGNETVNLMLSAPTNGAGLGAGRTAVLTIVDNDVTQGLLQFSAATYSVTEGVATGLATITVTRTGAPALAAQVPVTVAYAVTDGTATGGGVDYGPPSGTGTLTFGPGITSQTVTIPITDDALAEGNETVNLTLSTPANGAGLGAIRTTVLTIVDNDLTHGLLQFSAATYTVAENVPGGLATITVTRTVGTSGPVTVDYATSDGTATAGADYTATSGTLTFATGQTSRTFTVPILPDALAEGNETVTLMLSTPTGGDGLGVRQTAVLTIVDNDVTQGLLQFSAATYSVTEGVATGLATITVTRTGAPALAAQVPVTVAYAVTDGTATGGGVDYGPPSGTGTLTFGPGITSQTVTIPITDDALAEGNETVNLTLSTPANGAGLGAIRTTVLTIVDNDLTHGLLQFSAATYTVAENVPGGLATITVTRTVGTSGPVTVDYATSDGTATAGADYTATSGTLTFATGQTSRTFTVPILPDALAEGNETVTLMLSTPTGGDGLGVRQTAVLTIVDNDVTQGLLQFSAATYSVTEGVATGLATITVTRTGAPALAAQVPVTVAYAVTDGTATGGGVDYGPPSGTGTLTFGPGITSQTVTIPITDDALAEGNETVNLTLSTPANGAGLGAIRTTVLTIVDNDLTHGLLQFSAATYTVAENVPGGLATITVTRTVGTSGPVTVDYATSDGTATAGADYTATSGTLTFATGQTSRTFTVPILPDALAEGNETVTLMLSTPTGGDGLGVRQTAVLTIVDNDVTQGLLQFSAATYSVTEGVATGLATITVTRTGAPALAAQVPVTVAYAVTDGTATGGGVDYGPPSGTGTLTFGPGITSQTVTIPITNDTSHEGPETVNLTLSNPTAGAGLGANRTAVLTITDND